MEKIERGDILTLMDENNQEQEFEVLGTLSIDGTEYAAVGSVEETQKEPGEEIEIFFFKIDDEEQLTIIESGEEFDKVFVAFDESIEQ
ncbi:DUF1292 domain-containing protein [Domibacillus epiphyticus]|uniref:DUF1292 domain-containing protein n=1 Tax=Domibacillus epiphyticus TaxID=1714355 RepID=A0A1V2A8Q2_9BACI|nr:DUF1292 domain-containing protein [Domibacillus epiphyticus]OMP67346.1 DUF1292 domain-containing protein [Domibacillus epiphyticus]